MIFPLRDENPVQIQPVVTYAIIAINLVALLWLNQLPAPRQQMVVLEYGFIPARFQQLFRQQPLVIEVPREERHPQLPVVVQRRDRVRFDPVPREILAAMVTAMFLHGGWLHLISNMWFLFIFGNNVEERLGHLTYALFYLAGGLIATMVHLLQDPSSTVPVIGASGAVAAILGAYAIKFPNHRIKTLVFLFVFITIIDLPALVVLGLWFFGQLLNATQAVRIGIDGGVAWWAHVGGFVAGLVFMPLLSGDEPDDATHAGTRRDEDEDDWYR